MFAYNTYIIIEEEKKNNKNALIKKKIRYILYTKKLSYYPKDKYLHIIHNNRYVQHTIFTQTCAGKAIGK